MKTNACRCIDRQTYYLGRQVGESSMKRRRRCASSSSSSPFPVSNRACRQQSHVSPHEEEVWVKSHKNRRRKSSLVFSDVLRMRSSRSFLSMGRPRISTQRIRNVGQASPVPLPLPQLDFLKTPQCTKRQLLRPHEKVPM